jgi:hypothetical protein
VVPVPRRAGRTPPRFGEVKTEVFEGGARPRPAAVLGTVACLWTADQGITQCVVDLLHRQERLP